MIGSADCEDHGPGETGETTCESTARAGKSLEILVALYRKYRKALGRAYLLAFSRFRL
jgi:hypothetical protein